MNFEIFVILEGFILLIFFIYVYFLLRKIEKETKKLIEKLDKEEDIENE
jgi:preprotein translocase subunit YajC